MTQSSVIRGLFAVTTVGASLFLAVPRATPATSVDGSPKQLAIRCDDVGMCHTVILAVRELLETDVPEKARLRAFLEKLKNKRCEVWSVHLNR